MVMMLLLLAVLVPNAEADDEDKVVFVYDGDTVLLQDGRCIRYLGINTPEIDHKGNGTEPMAREAFNFNKKRVDGVSVRLEYDQEATDPHGRDLAYVFLPDGAMMNALLVRSGLGYVMSVRPNLRYRDLLVNSQRAAMEQGTGIWRHMSRAGGLRVGNTRSYRFHRTDCPFAKRIAKSNRIRFKSRFDAFWEGYAPCRRCKP